MSYSSHTSYPNTHTPISLLRQKYKALETQDNSRTAKEATE